MKKLFLTLVMLFMLVGQAFALGQSDTILGTFGDRDVNGDYLLKAQTDGTYRYLRFRAGTGGVSGGGLLFPFETYVTNSAVTANESGHTLIFAENTNYAAVADDTLFTLPASNELMTFTFVNDTTKYMRIKPAAGDQIDFAGTAVNYSITDKTGHARGDSITLFCYYPGFWAVRVGQGTWTMVNP